MDTKVFVQDTVSRALDKYLELHPEGFTDDTNWLSLEGTNSAVRYRKKSGWVCVRSSNMRVGDGYAVIGTLPEGFRPSSEFMETFAMYGTTVKGKVLVETSGQVRVVDGQEGAVNFHIVYPV